MLTVTHKFVSTKPNSVDLTLVNPSNWNDTHAIIDTSSTTYYAPDYNWSQPANNRTLVVGSNALTLNPVPLTLQVGDFVCISGGTGSPGTDEPALITGWNATTGQIIITCIYSHSGAWSISSGSSGIQEAINTAAAAFGGYVTLYQGITQVCATINMRSGIHIRGFGLYESIVRKTGDYGDTFYCKQINSISFEWFTIRQDIQYQPGTPGSAINIPTHGAHINLVGCNTVNIMTIRFETGFINLRIIGGALVYSTFCQFYGIWDNRVGSPKITQSNVHIECDSIMGIPTYIGFYGCVHVGNSNGTTNTPTNYNGVGSAYGMHILGCEDLEVIGGSLGGCNLNNVIIELVSSTIIALNIRFTSVKFDSAGFADFNIVATDHTKNCGAITIANNIFNGEYAGQNAIWVSNGGSGPPVVNSLLIDNCVMFAYIYSPLRIEDGNGVNVNNNFVYAYNISNTTNQILACGIYMGGRAAKYIITNNVIGGGLQFEDYNGTTNFCTYGIVSSSAAGINNNNTPSPFSIGNRNDLVYSRHMETCTVGLWPPAPTVGSYVWVTNSGTNTWGDIIVTTGPYNVMAVWNGANWTVAGR